MTARTRHRLAWVRPLAGAVLTLALSVPAAAQGKSQQAHGKSSPNKPSQSVLPVSSGGAAVPPTVTSAAPFAWVDNAALLPAGMVWIGLSVTRWQGAGLSEVNVPVVDAAVGVSRRVQLGASVPRVAGSGDPANPGGGMGTTFFSAKVAAYRDDARGLSVAVAPTLEVLGRAAVQTAPDGPSRTQFGLPISVDLNRRAARFYGSAGYFSPGIWFAGAGGGRMVTSRVGVAISYSRAWATSPVVDPAVPTPSRNDLTGGVSVDLTPHVGLFGSLGRTIGTRDENGAGTTLSVGVSFTAGPVTFVK